MHSLCQISHTKKILLPLSNITTTIILPVQLSSKHIPLDVVDMLLHLFWLVQNHEEYYDTRLHATKSGTPGAMQVAELHTKTEGTPYTYCRTPLDLELCCCVCLHVCSVCLPQAQLVCKKTM